MKCKTCHKEEAKFWYGFLNVCPDCYNKLMGRRIEQKKKENKQDVQ